MILTAVNHGDNTGATLSVTGNPGTASIFLSRFAGTNAERGWSLAGTIVGDSSLELPLLGLGPYLAFAASGSTLATPLSFRVTDATDALHWRTMEAVREYILGLALPHVSADPDDHVLVKLPYRSDMTLALDRELTDCAVMYFPKAETYTDADNERNQIDYGVQVLLVRKIGQKVSKGLKGMLKIRELMGAGMTVSPLPDLQEIHTVNVQPGMVTLPEQWANSYDCSTVVFRCLTEQPAGIF